MIKLIFFYFIILPYFYLSISWNLFQLRNLLIIILFTIFYKSSFFTCISYNYGIDFYSYGLIILAILVISLIVISRNSIKGSLLEKLFLFLNLILCLNLILIFCTSNIFIIYLFFEFRLIFLLIIIYTWGYQPERLISGLYLFFYTLFSSLPFFLIIIYLIINEITLIFIIDFQIPCRFIIYIFTIFVFLVKIPIFIVHFWLPRAHVQAPVAGSIILAGLLLKIGGYGLIRFIVLYEVAFFKYNFIIYSLSIIGCILVSLVCLVQADVKCLIAYSSVSHIGICLLGLISITKWGILGSFLIIISHGLCSSGLFCLANFCYERYSSRRFFINKGLINLIPRISILWFTFCCFNIRCPPRLNFFSEVFIINSIIIYWSNSFRYFLFISFFVACFRYYIYRYIQHGLPYQFYCYSIGFIREYLLILIHLIPLFTVILSLNFFF